ncbi:MAG: 16S rRNA (cytosine(1402)-N(4))-methyltransferase RsmH [Gaiellales bacterium]
MGRDYHVPVMADRVEHWLGAIDGTIVDATFGGGGHSRVLLEANPRLSVVALDRDPDAGPKSPGSRLVFRQANFTEMESVIREENLDEIGGALFDLGVSSHQLDVGERGFSYRLAGPLDMRMGPDAALDASVIVNEWPEADVARVLRRYGEERHAGRIAAAIVRGRPIADTVGLASVVADAVPARSRRRGHPARRTFQALRIAVNDELVALGDALDVALRLLRRGGRIVVISYHSLEDRIVKRRFAAGAEGCTCPPDLPVCVCDTVAELRLLTRGGETPSAEEIAANPRSRSARLRAAERVA